MGKSKPANRKIHGLAESRSMSAELQCGQFTDAIQSSFGFGGKRGKRCPALVVLESGLWQLMPQLVALCFEVPLVVLVDGADDGDLVGDG